MDQNHLPMENKLKTFSSLNNFNVKNDMGMIIHATLRDLDNNLINKQLSIR